MFRFSIRELMLVTLVVAGALGWWIDHSHQVSESGRYASEAARYKEYLLEFRERGFPVGRMLDNMEIQNELDAAWKAKREFDAHQERRKFYDLLSKASTGSRTKLEKYRLFCEPRPKSGLRETAETQ
jgi:hypothetical protein